MSESDAALGACGWCGEPSITEVIVVPGRKRKKKAPACEKHAARFERQGQMTTRLEVQQKMEADRKRSQWNRTKVWR